MNAALRPLAPALMLYALLFLVAALHACEPRSTDSFRPEVLQ